MVNNNEKPEGTLKVADLRIMGTLWVDDTNTAIVVPNETNNVTITNIAPAGVGTATISAWLKVAFNSNSTFYYIPMWT